MFCSPRLHHHQHACNFPFLSSSPFTPTCNALSCVFSDNFSTKWVNFSRSIQLFSALRHESQKNISKVEIFPFCWFMSRSIIGKFPSTKISRKSISRDLLAPGERATMNFTNETIRKKRCWLQPLIFSQWLTFIYMTLHSNASRMISRVIRYTNTRSILHRQAKKNRIVFRRKRITVETDDRRSRTL